MRSGFSVFCFLFVAASDTANAELVVDGSFRPPVLEQAATVSDAQPASDDRFIIVGPFSSVGSQQRPLLARVLRDGRLDAAFNAQGVVSVASVLLLSDGRLLVAGTFDRGGQRVSGIFRLQDNGLVDPSFFGALPVGMGANALALTPDGKVVAAGGGGPGIARFLCDGSIDGSFQTGSGFNDR